MAERFQRLLLGRVEDLAPGLRVTVAFWNDHGYVTEGEIQKLTVASERSETCVFEIPSADLDLAYSSYSSRQSGDPKAFAKLDRIQTQIARTLASLPPDR
jgi:hypothetical protein